MQGWGACGTPGKGLLETTQWTNHASLRKSLPVKVLKATEVLGGSADVLILFLLFSSPVLTGCVGDRVLG